ncbi:MAG: M48 family metallopeptidase [Bacteroidota bacterium]|jgi:heat shock protein HtpX
MQFIGLQSQIARNNRRSFLLLIGFPALILFGILVIMYFSFQGDTEQIASAILMVAPFVLAGVGIWFLIAYLSHTAIIRATTGSRTLERKENQRVYNLTENLCMSVGMPIPKLYVIDSPVLNAYASGIDKNSFAVTLTTGIIETLDDHELEGVIAHELTHIRNRDVRLLIISIIFVGIFAFIVEILFRSVLHGNRGRRDKSDGRVLIIALLVAIVVYFFSILFRFALSRSREYMADAGAVEMTKNGPALASALRKISGNSDLDAASEDVKELYIDNSKKKAGFFSFLSGLFATHPPIEKRIQILEHGI